MKALVHKRLRRATTQDVLRPLYEGAHALGRPIVFANPPKPLHVQAHPVVVNVNAPRQYIGVPLCLPTSGSSTLRWKWRTTTTFATHGARSNFASGRKGAHKIGRRGRRGRKQHKRRKRRKQRERRERRKQRRQRETLETLEQHERLKQHARRQPTTQESSKRYRSGPSNAHGELDKAYTSGRAAGVKEGRAQVQLELDNLLKKNRDLQREIDSLRKHAGTQYSSGLPETTRHTNSDLDEDHPDALKRRIDWLVNQAKEAAWEARWKSMAELDMNEKESFLAKEEIRLRSRNFARFAYNAEDHSDYDDDGVDDAYERSFAGPPKDNGAAQQLSLMPPAPLRTERSPPARSPSPARSFDRPPSRSGFIPGPFHGPYIQPDDEDDGGGGEPQGYEQGVQENDGGYDYYDEHYDAPGFAVGGDNDRGVQENADLRAAADEDAKARHLQPLFEVTSLEGVLANVDNVDWRKAPWARLWNWTTLTKLPLPLGRYGHPYLTGWLWGEIDPKRVFEDTRTGKKFVENGPEFTRLAEEASELPFGSRSQTQRQVVSWALRANILPKQGREKEPDVVFECRRNPHRVSSAIRRKQFRAREVKNALYTEWDVDDIECSIFYRMTKPKPTKEDDDWGKPWVEAIVDALALARDNLEVWEEDRTQHPIWVEEFEGGPRRYEGDVHNTYDILLHLRKCGVAWDRLMGPHDTFAQYIYCMVAHSDRRRELESEFDADVKAQLEHTQVVTQEYRRRWVDSRLKYEAPEKDRAVFRTKFILKTKAQYVVGADGYMWEELPPPDEDEQRAGGKAGKSKRGKGSSSRKAERK
ncbi:hypothetical protein EXIGLDRAFT_708213 [Exidia glandulosa HHB12029]|uniref:Uncharacterized protein n=1 Tax=Exidia glandulosa HHB12029 TaxID=1314781 RepID=A0A166N8I9_EXIGL|nr:hypothetical protein EXIGLDRAFT_708213 [Exidia glandulosa HHB12029]